MYPEEWAGREDFPSMKAVLEAFPTVNCAMRVVKLEEDFQQLLQHAKMKTVPPSHHHSPQKSLIGQVIIFPFSSLLATFMVLSSPELYVPCQEKKYYKDI